MKMPFRIFIPLSLFLLIMADTTAQRCPRNQYDCPGLCGWLVDTNRDGYCDLSLFSIPVLEGFRQKQDSLCRAEREQLIRDSLAKASRQNSEEGKNPVIAQHDPDGQMPMENAPCNEVEGSGSPGQGPDAANGETAGNIPPQKVLKKSIRTTYDFFLIFGISLGLYLLTYFLARRGTIKKATHRKIWNVLLLLAFLPTALIGLLLALQANYAFWLGSFADLLYWHVEFAIAMAAIAVFHILWHLRYWSMLLKANGKCKENE